MRHIFLFVLSSFLATSCRCSNTLNLVCQDVDSPEEFCATTEEGIAREVERDISQYVLQIPHLDEWYLQQTKEHSAQDKVLSNTQGFVVEENSDVVSEPDDIVDGDRSKSFDEMFFDMEIRGALSQIAHLLDREGHTREEVGEPIIWPPYATNAPPSTARRSKEKRKAQITERRDLQKEQGRFVWPPYVTNAGLNQQTIQSNLHGYQDDDIRPSDSFLLRVAIAAALGTSFTILLYQLFKIIAFYIFGAIGSHEADSDDPDDSDVESQKKRLVKRVSESDFIVKSATVNDLSLHGIVL